VEGHAQDSLWVPASGVDRQVVDREVVEVDVVVVAVALGLAVATLSGFGLCLFEGLVLPCRDAVGAYVQRRSQPQFHVGVLARHPAGEARFEHEVVTLGGDVPKLAVQITVDLVVFLGGFVQLERCHPALFGQRAENIAATDVLVVQGVGQTLGKCALDRLEEEQMELMTDQMGMFKQQFRPMVWIMLVNIPLFLWLYWIVFGAGVDASPVITLPIFGEVEAWSNSVAGPVQAWIVWYFLCSLSFTQIIRKALNVETTPTG